jgi:hypothetical protein
MRPLKQRPTRPLAVLAIAVVLFVTVGCTDAGEDPCGMTSGQVVASADGWVPLAADSDPFWDSYEGDPRVCATDSHGPEVGTDGTWWEIETVTCGYLTLEQPTTAPLCAGDTLLVRLWHFNLLDTGDDFRVAISFGDDPPVVDETVAVPADSELVEFRSSLGASVPSGTLIRFHLSNHGSNSWGLMDIVVE